MFGTPAGLTMFLSAPLEAEVVQLDKADLESVHAEDDAGVSGEEVVRRPRAGRLRADADAVLEGTAVPVVLFLGRVGQALEVFSRGKERLNRIGVRGKREQSTKRTERHEGNWWTIYREKRGRE